MIRRTTWMILAIFVVLVGLAIYLQRSQKSAAAQATPTVGQQPLLQIDEKNITNLKIEDDQGRVVSLGRDSQGLWSLVQPTATATDVSQAESAVSQLVSLSVVNTLDPAPPLNAIGLSPAKDTLTVSLKDGSQRVIRVGNLTPIGNGYYAQVDQGPVSVVGDYGVEALLKILDQPPILDTPTPTGQVTTPAPGTPPAQGTLPPAATPTP